MRDWLEIWKKIKSYVLHYIYLCLQNLFILIVLTLIKGLFWNIIPCYISEQRIAYT